MAFASLRRFAFAAVLSAAALAAHGALAAAATAARSPTDRRHGRGAEARPVAGIVDGRRTGVPVIEYGSATCPHCAHFDKDVWPEFKKAYVDTGKVRFIFREYSRNDLDVAAFMLARCLGDDKTSPQSNCCSPRRTTGLSETIRWRIDRRASAGRPDPR